MPEVESPIGPVYHLGPIDVCNNALDEIGQNTIDSFTDGTPASEACKVFFPSNLKAMLSKADYKFASRRVYLPELSQERILQILGGFGSGGFGGGGFGGGGTEITVTAVPGPYNRWYGLPNNCIKPRRINGSDSFTWALKGRILMTNIAPVYLDYGAYVDDPNTWEGTFQSAFEKWLASRLSARLLHDLKMAAGLYAEYRELEADAMAVNSLFGTPEKLTSNAFIFQRE